MPNLEFQQIRTLKKYVDEQENLQDARKGSVLKEGFDFDVVVAALQKEGWSSNEIIQYIIAANQVLWAQYWLKNPQDPSKPLELSWYQKNILNCTHQYKLTRCGRQIGKTISMAVHMLHGAMTTSDLSILYVVPYLSQVKVLFDSTLLPLVHDVPEVRQSIVRIINQPFHQAIFADGSTISARTAGTRSGQKAGSIRGTTAKRLYLDEADYLGDDAIAAIVAVTFAQPDATLWASSTPTGKREEFYKWSTERDSRFRCTNYTDDETMHSPFHYPSQVSPRFTDEADRFYKQSMSELNYVHEVEADWGEEAEGVFKHRDIDVCLELGRTDTIHLADSEDAAQKVGYTYENLHADRNNLYMLGVDWNKDTTGVQLCVIEYNPNNHLSNGVLPKMYRIFRTEVVTAQEFTEQGAVSRILQLSNIIPLDGIYADEGYGTIQIEAIRRIASSSGLTALADKVVAINMSSYIEIVDPHTQERKKKAMKPFMVDNSARVVESHRIMLPDHEDYKVKVVGQMREYIVLRRSESGRPVYSDENEDMLTAFMLALLGFALKYSELTNQPTPEDVEISPVSPTTRAIASIPSRTNVEMEDEFDKAMRVYKVSKRGPKLEELAMQLSPHYSYTTDSRPEELRPSESVVPIYRENLRGSRASESTGSRRGAPAPGRRTF